MSKGKTLPRQNNKRKQVARDTCEEHQMDKISLNSTKLGELRFPADQFAVPQVGQVVSARVTAKRDENNEPISGSVAKIALEVINFKTYQTIAREGEDISDLARIIVDVVAPENMLKQHTPETLMGKLIDLRSAKVALRWVSRGQSGSWGGLKLVLESLQVVQTQNQGAK